MEAEKKKVDEVLVQIAEEKEGLEADRNNLDVEKEEMRLENAHLQSELDEAHIRIQVCSIDDILFNLVFNI